MSFERWNKLVDEAKQKKIEKINTISPKKNKKKKTLKGKIKAYS